MSETFETETGFVRQHRPALVVGGLVLVAIALAAFFLSRGDDRPVQRLQQFTMVRLAPPPPPPPPPPQQQVVPKMIEQPHMTTPEMIKPEHVDASKPNAPAKGPVGLDDKGTGPGDSFNLAGNPGGNGILEGGGGGSRWGWYASIVQDQIAEALRLNPKTRDARFRVEIRLWSDATGRVARVALVTSTGDPALDTTITRDVLQGLQIRQPPPSDMPMPIVMRVTGSATG